MTAKEWLGVMQSAADYNKSMTPLIEKYGELLISEQQKEIERLQNVGIGFCNEIERLRNLLKSEIQSKDK